MPISLSFFLTLSAIAWLSYGVLLKDLFISVSNSFIIIIIIISLNDKNENENNNYRDKNECKKEIT